MLHIQTLLAFITLHPALAYGTVFLVSLSESLALVGLVVPGTMIMFGIGAVVATGSLGLQPVLLLAAAGAIAGDGISYWLGRHYQEKLRRIWPFSRYSGLLKNGEAFFHRHGGKSILLGRFVGPVRPVIPVVAGMLGMRPLHFAVVNVASAIGWALVYVLPGVFFGTSLAVAGAVSTRLAVLLLILFAAIWGFVWLGRKLAALVGRHGPVWLATLENWAVADKPVHRVQLPFKRVLSSLFLRPQGEALFLSFLTILLLAAGWGFLAVLQDVLAKDPLVLADQAVYHFFQSLRTPWSDHMLVAVTELGDAFVNTCVACAVLVVLVFTRCYRTVGYWLLTLVGGFAGVQLLKWLVHLPRPVALYHGASAFGFPSGHTTMSIILYGFLAIVMARSLSATLRWGLFVTVFALSFLIALSRLYLGAHWFSDVLGGLLIGTSWTTLLGIAYVKGPCEKVPKRLLAAIVLLVLAIAGGWHVSQRHKQDLTFYAPQKSIQSMPSSAWLADGWRELPVWSIDMEGESQQPLTIQWAGSIETLDTYLLSNGWQRPPTLNGSVFLKMLSPDTKIEELPVLPRLHDGRFDSLILIREHNGQRWVLRLWPTDREILENQRPLFVGTIETQKERRIAGLMSLTQKTGEYAPALDALQQVLDDRFSVKQVWQKKTTLDVDPETPQSIWDGKVLLVSDKNYLAY